MATPTIFTKKDSAGSLCLLIQYLGLVCQTGGQRKGAGLVPTHSYRGGTRKGTRTDGFQLPSWIDWALPHYYYYSKESSFLEERDSKSKYPKILINNFHS